MLLTLQQLLNQLIFSIDLVFKDIDNEVFGGKHILKIAGQCIETVMRASLGLFSVDGHPALVALVGARATVLLMVHDVEPLDFLVTVNARHHHIGTCCLVQIYIFA